MRDDCVGDLDHTAYLAALGAGHRAIDRALGSHAVARAQTGPQDPRGLLAGPVTREAFRPGCPGRLGAQALAASGVAKVAKVASVPWTVAASTRSRPCCLATYSARSDFR